VTGALATVGGLTLMAIGIVHLLSCIRTRWGRMVAIPLGLVALAYVLAPIGLGVLVTNRARPVLGPRTPSDVGLSYEDVVLETTDGLRLTASYVAIRERRRGAGAAGSGSTRDDVLDHAAMLAGTATGPDRGRPRARREHG